MHQLALDDETRMLAKRATKALKHAVAVGDEKEIKIQRKELGKKPKVAPVIGSAVKQAKMLAAAMTGMEISASKASKSRKIIMADSSEDEDEEEGEGEGMEVDRDSKLTPKPITKKNISRRWDI